MVHLPTNYFNASLLLVSFVHLLTVISCYLPFSVEPHYLFKFSSSCPWGCFLVFRVGAEKKHSIQIMWNVSFENCGLRNMVWILLATLLNHMQNDTSWSIVSQVTLSGGKVWIFSPECHFLSLMNLKIQSMNNKHMNTILKNIWSIHFTLQFKIKLPKVKLLLIKSIISIYSLWNVPACFSIFCMYISY